MTIYFFLDIWILRGQNNASFLLKFCSMVWLLMRLYMKKISSQDLKFFFAFK